MLTVFNGLMPKKIYFENVLFFGLTSNYFARVKTKSELTRGIKIILISFAN